MTNFRPIDFLFFHIYCSNTLALVNTRNRSTLPASVIVIFAQIGNPSKISKRPNSILELEIDAVQTPIFTVRLGTIDAVVDFRQRAPQVPKLENVFCPLVPKNVIRLRG